MRWFELFCMTALVTYVVFILRNIFTLFPRKKKVVSEHTPSQTISIIIPARDEEENILSCLKSIAQQDFPKEILEVIVIDDHSFDSTPAIAKKFLEENFPRHQLIRLDENEKGKKTAIQKAVEQSSGDIIITRDADTVTQNDQWLKEISRKFEKTNCEVLLSPVLLSGDNSFTSSFQKYENLAISLLGAGMAKNSLPIVCSGANLAYRKTTFEQMDPYRNNFDIPSGDDMFLLKKAFSNKISIGVNSQSVVLTSTEKSFSGMLSQRLRWAAKTPRISTLPILFSGLILLAGNLACLLLILNFFIDTSYLGFGLFTLISKALCDFLLLFLSALMFNVKFNPTWFLPAFVFNLFYTPAVAMVSVFVKPSWKGRR